MAPKHKHLLTVDGLVNLILGILLLFLPGEMIAWLGLPQTGTIFYVSILGGVLGGIGIALFLERYGALSDTRGLGLGGAVAINLCGGGALLIQVMTAPLDLPLHGRVILWTVGVLVVLIGVVEIAVQVRDPKV